MPGSSLTLQERITTYEALKKISKNAASTSEMISELRREGYAIPSRETIRLWNAGIASPLTGVRVFSPLPCEELSFFIGAWLGDGWGDENDGGKRMRLKVRSETFAEVFAQAASRILTKEVPYRIWVTCDDGGPWYNVKVTSQMLFEFVNRPFSELKKFIEPFSRGFLRGFFTAEGNPSVSVQRRGPRLEVGLDLSNTDFDLLCFSRHLLLSLGFQPSRIRLVQLEGERSNLSIATKPGWLLTVLRFDDVKRFAGTIGFADREKQAKLEDAISMIKRFGHEDAVGEWERYYKKGNHKWAKKRA